MTVLLAGGAGYIGSHTAVELLNAGHEAVILDDFRNSNPSVIDRIEKVTGSRPAVYEADAADKEAVERIFAENKIDAVIHFAGLKAVGESVAKPLEYYRNNVDTTLTLLEVMRAFDCRNFVFSSSATVYGMKNESPLVETMAIGGCSNPYGWTKVMNEQILMDAARADPALSVVLLRYFNPIGAHKSGLLGDQPNGIPNNLMPYITQVAIGKLSELSVFGNDYPTPDGTCRRDYIHVVDLAKGHLAALNYAAGHKGAEAVNLGAGTAYSVLEVVRTFERVNGLKIPIVFAPRRAGDLAVLYADASKAERLFGWHTELGLEDMCRDSWRWQQNAGL